MVYIIHCVGSDTCEFLVRIIVKVQKLKLTHEMHFITTYNICLFLKLYVTSCFFLCCKHIVEVEVWLWFFPSLPRLLFHLTLFLSYT